MNCYVCNEPLLAPGEKVTALTHLVPMQGGKSGQLGLYPDPDYQERPTDHVHKDCRPPLDQESYDTWHDDMLDQFREEAKEELDEEVAMFLALEPDEPNCLWCKHNQYVVGKMIAGISYKTCLGCRRSWDEKEEEIELFPWLKG